jgi:hypothetical protein
MKLSQKKKGILVHRVFHPWWKWECFKAGFYNTTAPENIDTDTAHLSYYYFLKDLNKFKLAMERVKKEWVHSCEHFLTNPSMNRIAWLGQSAMCISTGIPSCFRSGFQLLSEDEQRAADKLAEEFLVGWLDEYNRKSA